MVVCSKNNLLRYLTYPNLFKRMFKVQSRPPFERTLLFDRKKFGKNNRRNSKERYSIKRPSPGYRQMSKLPSLNFKNIFGLINKLQFFYFLIIISIEQASFNLTSIVSATPLIKLLELEIKVIKHNYFPVSSRQFPKF
jgi:hypothetical protein